MGAYTGVCNCLNKPLPDIAISLGYSRANILILEGNIGGLKRDYEQIYHNLLSCKHHRDNRAPLEYGRDLVASWIFEDTFLKALQHAKTFSIDLDGADKKREILANAKTSTSSDYVIHIKGGDLHLELMCDYTGFWNRTHLLHLRDNKYLQMQNSNSLFVAVSTTNKQFALLDFRGNIPAKFIPSHLPYGGKPAYEIDLNNINFFDYTSSNLISIIENSL